MTGTWLTNQPPKMRAMPNRKLIAERDMRRINAGIDHGNADP